MASMEEMRKHQVNVRLNDAELRTLREFSKRWGYTPSEAVRFLLRLSPDMKLTRADQRANAA